MKVFYIDPQSYNVLGQYDVSLLQEIVQLGVNIEFICHENLLKEEYMVDVVKSSIRTLFKYQQSHPSLQKALSYILSYCRILTLIIADWPDVIHIQWTRLPLVDILFIRFFTFLKIPVIYTSHNFLPHKQNFLSFFLSKITCQSATRIIVHSQSTKDLLVSHFSSSLDKVCIVIPYGKLGAVSKNAKILQHKSPKKISHYHLRFTILGSIRVDKGIMEYLEVWYYVFKKHIDSLSGVELRIVGRWDPGYFDKASEFIKTNGITNVFLHNKWLSSQEFQEEIANSDVCVLPYLSMSQSGVLMTLLAYQKPCIVSDVGGLPEPFAVAKVGWVFSWQEDLKLIAEKSILKPISDVRSGWKPSSEEWQTIDEHFSWNRAAKTTVSLYKDLHKELQ
jgi:glycosyltransferase involved in cell wall biosynthesis